jgi:hypothetical protein
MQITKADSTLSISAMAPWDLWAHPRSIGLDKETFDAVTSGRASSDQVVRAGECFEAARRALMNAEASVPLCRKPS